MGCCRSVKLLVCELVMAGRSAEQLVGLAELGAIQGMENREQVTETRNRIKEIYTKHRGRKEGGSSREMCLGFLDLREAKEFCYGWIPGTPGFTSQFQRK